MIKYVLILIFVCIAVSYVGCDAKTTAPTVSKSSSSACVNSTRKAYKTGKSFDCEYREKKR